MLETYHSTAVSDAPAVKDEYLSSRQTRKRYGGVSRTTIERWRRTQGFPKPRFFGGRMYFSLRQLLAWERDQEALKQAQDAA